MTKEVRFSNDIKSMTYIPPFKQEDINYSDELRYCIKCKKRTPTTDFKITDKTINRTKKNGEISTITRQIINGTCSICNTKKHLFTGNNDEHDYERKAKNEELDSIRDSILEED